MSGIAVRQTIDTLMLPPKADQVLHSLRTDLGNSSQKLTTLAETYSVIPIGQLFVVLDQVASYVDLVIDTLEKSI